MHHAADACMGALRLSLPGMTTDFLHDIALNRTNAAILARWEALALPNAWLVAGCLFQTIWNVQSGRPPGFGIKDYDIFYFDDGDLTETGEQAAQARANAVFSDLGVTLEVANQARVHLWYPGYFSRPYPQLGSADAGIERFLVLETCVGVRPNQLCAPHGVAGVYAGTLSPNPLTPYPELFASKVASYRARWPHLDAAVVAGGGA